MEIIEVDTQQTVNDLKKLVQNVVGYPTSRFRLYYKECIDSEPEEMTYPTTRTSLYRLNLNEDSEFIVDLTPYEDWKLPTKLKRIRNKNRINKI